MTTYETFWVIMRCNWYATGTAHDCPYSADINEAYLFTEDPSEELEDGEHSQKVELTTIVTRKMVF